MILTLRNFRCWENATFEFPDTGSVLITAPSGSGKTSLMKAIQFAIYGNSSVKRNQIRWGCVTCYVILEFRGLIIKRSKKPERLLVQYEGNSYEDQEAQSIITLHLHGFHLDQKGRNSFLLMNASEKLEFIQTLSVTNRGIEWMEKITQKIKGLEEVLNQQQKIKVSLRPPLKTPSEESINFTLETIETQIQESLNFISRVKEAQEKLLEFERLNHKWDTYEELLRQRDDYLSQLQTLPDLKEIQTLLDKYQQWKDYSKACDKLEEIQATCTFIDVNNPPERTPEDCSHLLYILDKLESIPTLTVQEFPLDLEETYLRLQQDIKMYKKTWKCPSCTVPLYYENDQLNLYTLAEPSSEEMSLEDTFKDVEKQYKRQQEYLRKKTEREFEEQTYQSQLPEGIVKSVLEQQYKESILFYTSKKEKEQREKTLEILTLQAKKLQCEMPTASYEQLLEWRFNRNKLTEKLQGVAVGNPPDYLASEEQVKEWEEIVTNNTSSQLPQLLLLKDELVLRNQWQEYNDRVGELESGIKLLEQKYLVAKKFKTIMKEAESIHLSNSIDTLSQHVQYVLDAFFPQDPMSITLEFIKKGKVNPTPQLNLLLHYKGNDTDPSTLSEGEFDRLVLAFTLALNEMANSPFIILDECIGTLDHDNAENVFHYIQKINRLTLVVAHQVVTGGFDTVINL